MLGLLGFPGDDDGRPLWQERVTLAQCHLDRVVERVVSVHAFAFQDLRRQEPEQRHDRENHTETPATTLQGQGEPSPQQEDQHGRDVRQPQVE